MPLHKTIVIGASAGGLEPLRTIVSELPAALPAAIAVVQHVAASGPTLLPEILDRSGRLPVSHARDGMAFEAGTIVVASPNHHLLLRDGHLHLSRGPKENGFRPAIDATFRTAAESYGPWVVGVVLSGMLDDGTAGLLAIKRRGGTAIVQDPNEAQFPSMPESACRYVQVDAVLPASSIAELLVRLAYEPAPEESGTTVSERMRLENQIAAMEPNALHRAESFGPPAAFTCPECGGVLTDYHDGDLLRFRCQVGHAFSPKSLFDHHGGVIDTKLWAAYRALDERIQLAKQLSGDARRRNDRLTERRFTMQLAQLRHQRELLRQAIIADEASAGPENGGEKTDRPTTT